jgi:hypothetical protein
MISMTHVSGNLIVLSRLCFHFCVAKSAGSVRSVNKDFLAVNDVPYFIEYCWHMLILLTLSIQ